MSPRQSAPARLGRIPAGGLRIDLNALVEPYLGAIVLGLLGAVVLLILLALIQAIRIRRLGRRLDGLTRGVEGRSLEAILDAHLDKVFKVARELDELSARSAVLEANGRRAFQRVGLVRYNPFEDTGGNQSFAVALLDAHLDKVFKVARELDELSARSAVLDARAGTRVYAKKLTGGRSDAALSDEEAEALRLAVASGTDRTRASS